MTKFYVIAGATRFAIQEVEALTKEEAERSCYIGYGINVGCFEIKWNEQEEVEENSKTIESKKPKI